MTKRADGSLETQRISSRPLSFYFRLAPITYKQTLAGILPSASELFGDGPANAERCATVRTTITAARALARASAESDASEWLLIDAIGLSEIGYSGIRQLGLPEGEARLDFALPVAAMDKLATMTEFVIHAEWKSAHVNWQEHDTDPSDERGRLANAVWAEWCRDLVRKGKPGTFQYVAPIVVRGRDASDADRRATGMELLTAAGSPAKHLIEL